MLIHCKRVYDPAKPDDGYRVLVDRLWPRGIKKSELDLAAWWQELAPSTALRQWFNHKTAKWPCFIERYHQELTKQDALIQQHLAKAGPRLCLIYAAKNSQENNAVALKSHLEQVKHKAV